MQKPVKALLGLVTLWPIAYVFLFFVFFFSTFLFGPSAGDKSGAPPFVAVFIGLHLLTMFIIMALTVFYIVDVFRNDRVDKDKKALWAIVLFMGNAIAMPIYWYLYFWKEPRVSSQSSPELLTGVNTSAWTNDVRASRQEEPQYAPPSQPPNWRE